MFIFIFVELLENLSNEERTWEEIMQIKAMPIPMYEKKEMKAKLQVNFKFFNNPPFSLDRSCQLCIIGIIFCERNITKFSA